MRISDWSSDVCSSDLKAIPDLTLQIFVATEQYGLIFFSGNQYDHGLRFGKTGQIIEIAIVTIRVIGIAIAHDRSEERREGKELVRTCRSRWSLNHTKKKIKEAGIIMNSRI